jgi:hypothetical protein
MFFPPAVLPGGFQLPVVLLNVFRDGTGKGGIAEELQISP